AGKHGHQEEQVEVFEVGRSDRERRVRVQGQAGLEAEGARLLEQLVYAVELGVHGAAAGAGSGEGVEKGGGIVHHEVTVEIEVGMSAHSLDYRGADGEVGHEMRIHDVDVQKVRFGPHTVDRVAQR